MLLSATFFSVNKTLLNCLSISLPPTSLLCTVRCRLFLLHQREVSLRYLKNSASWFLFWLTAFKVELLKFGTVVTRYISSKWAEDDLFVNQCEQSEHKVQTRKYRSNWSNLHMSSDGWMLIDGIAQRNQMSIVKLPGSVIINAQNMSKSWNFPTSKAI